MLTQVLVDDVMWEHVIAAIKWYWNIRSDITLKPEVVEGQIHVNDITLTHVSLLGMKNYLCTMFLLIVNNL